MWIMLQKQNPVMIFFPSFSLQEIALKIVQEISPPVPQPISHLHGGKDFLWVESWSVISRIASPEPPLPHPPRPPFPCLLPVRCCVLSYTALSEAPCPKIALHQHTTLLLLNTPAIQFNNDFWLRARVPCTSLGPSLDGGLQWGREMTVAFFSLNSAAVRCTCLLFIRFLRNYRSLQGVDSSLCPGAAVFVVEKKILMTFLGSQGINSKMPLYLRAWSHQFSDPLEIKPRMDYRIFYVFSSYLS